MMLLIAKGPVAQRQEATDLGSAQCGFESLLVNQGIHHPTARVSAFQADDAGPIPAGCSILMFPWVMAAQHPLKVPCLRSSRRGTTI